MKYYDLVFEVGIDTCVDPFRGVPEGTTADCPRSQLVFHVERHFYWSSLPMTSFIHSFIPVGSTRRPLRLVLMLHIFFFCRFYIRRCFL